MFLNATVVDLVSEYSMKIDSDKIFFFDIPTQDNLFCAFQSCGILLLLKYEIIKISHWGHNVQEMLDQHYKRLGILPSSVDLMLFNLILWTYDHAAHAGGPTVWTQLLKTNFRVNFLCLSGGFCLPTH